MPTSRFEQYQVTMPDGLVIDRLPIGLADGEWHLTFVCSGVAFTQGEPPRFLDFHHEFSERVAVRAVTGELSYRGGGGGGGDRQQVFWMQFAHDEVSDIEIEIEYSMAGVSMTELVALTENDGDSPPRRGAERKPLLDD